MKKINIFYWIFTGLFVVMMLLSGVPDLLVVPDAVTFMTSLGYPKYIIPFLGFAKILGAIAILVPRFPRIKEWAYAGLAFDLIGATYSQIALNGFKAQILFMLLPIILGLLSYIFYHKKTLKPYQ